MQLKVGCFKSCWNPLIHMTSKGNMTPIGFQLEEISHGLNQGKDPPPLSHPLSTQSGENWIHMSFGCGKQTATIISFPCLQITHADVTIGFQLLSNLLAICPVGPSSWCTADNRRSSWNCTTLAVHVSQAEVRAPPGDRSSDCRRRQTRVSLRPRS